jgi:type VI secretion system secreted protein VgrG
MPENIHVLTFHSDALEDGTLRILELSGFEEISRYSVYNLELLSKKADIDFSDMLQNPARIEIKKGVKLAGSDKRGIQTLRIHGVLRSFEQVEQRLDWVRYRAELVPPLWKLSLTTQSRIFLDMSVPDIVKEVFQQYGFSPGTDFEMKNLSGYQPREFVMQYEETDLDFVDRWLEHEGIFYFWEHSDQGSKLVLANATAAYPATQGTSTISYNPLADTTDRVEVGESDKAAEDWFREEAISTYRCTQKVIPKKVVLKEYNWRKPTDELKVEQDVAKEGVGTIYESNNHYKDTGHGKKLAEARAQEHLCREIVFSGESDCKSFRAGATYKLEKHFRSDFNKDYLLISVNHSASQTVELATNQTINAEYRNTFSAIPADQVFRPLRQTKWPNIGGFISAKIDASGSGQYSEIDDMGRYKVKLPLDLSDKKDGKASRFVRMMQPYAGGGMGMHFPLHKGTEVALIFLDGDPDRPIIAGSIPNPDTASPVTGGNQTQCAVHTGGGNKITIEDTDGGQQISLFSPTSNTSITIGA